jgi:serine/threonine protein kinase
VSSSSSGANNSTAQCNGSVCCVIENYRVGSVNVFNTAVVGVVFVSILGIMWRMQGSAVRTQLPVYYNYLLLTCATFLIVILLQVLPSDGDSLVLDVLSTLLIMPQWVVQCGVVFFLLARNADTAAGVRAFWQASAFAAVLILVQVLPIALRNTGCDLCGAVVAQIVICAFFFYGFVVSLMPARRARPALRWWAAYQFVAHVLFLVEYALFQWLPGREVTMCFDVVSLLGYYVFYTPVLLLVVSSDTAYWRSHGALLYHYEQEDKRDPERDDDDQDGGDGDVDETVRATSSQLKLALSKVSSSGDAASGGDASGDDAAAAPDHSSASTYTSSTQTNVIDFAELEIGGVLGVGQFGVVHEGTFRQQQVAVKLLRQLPSSAISEVMRDLLRESRLLLALRSDYVVGCVGVILDDQHLGLVTELMEISLWDALHNTNEPDVTTPWPLERTVTIMTDVARGLQYLHTRRPPIIHRDIKSHNILLKFNGRTITPARPTVVLADEPAPPPPPLAPEVGGVHVPASPSRAASAAVAGSKAKRQLDWKWPASDVLPIAKVCDLGVSRAKLGTTHMTRVGTAHWAAVELLLGQPYNEKVDIYSYGVVWWECLARKKPVSHAAVVCVLSLCGTDTRVSQFASMSPARVIAAVSIEHLRLPVPAETPPPLASLIKRMWNTAPSKRPSAAETLKQLREIFGER